MELLHSLDWTQVPSFFKDKIVYRCVAVTMATNGTDFSGLECVCDNSIQLGSKCRYLAEEVVNVVNTFPWITATIIIAAITKIVPSIFMLVLNLAIIRKVTLTKLALIKRGKTIRINEDKRIRHNSIDIILS